MSETKHSPLPWIYEYDGTYARKPRVYSSDRRLVAEVGNAEVDQQDRWEADAKLLVRATSLHHEIVAALEPFVAMRDQSVRETVKLINKGMDGLTPISVTVTKDQFKAAWDTLQKAKQGDKQ